LSVQGLLSSQSTSALHSPKSSLLENPPTLPGNTGAPTKGTPLGNNTGGGSGGDSGGDKGGTITGSAMGSSTLIGGGTLIRESCAFVPERFLSGCLFLLSQLIREAIKSISQICFKELRHIFFLPK
jgi:hypothetical protein